MEVLLWIGFAQALFSGILFVFVKKDNSLANKILIAWLFIIAFEFLTTGIDISLGSNHLTNPFLIFNPLIYFYSKSLINPNYKLKWWQIWHIIPYLFIKTGAYISNIPLSPNDFFAIDSSTWFKMTYGVISVISFIGYSVASLINVHRHRINLKNEFSTIDRKITLGWLLFVIIFYMTFMSIAYILGIVNIIIRISTYAQLVTFAFLLALMYIFSFYGLLQGQIYAQEETGSPDYYKNPRLTTIEKQRIRKILEDYFKKEKPYLNSELTITNLSGQLKLSRHTLTELLNTEIGKNFYQFVNEYRVQEVKLKLANPAFAHFSIDAIGFECGFNSKSSFYAVFKNTTGMTPSQYKSSLKT
jgi:AraC-like DNA-binding protein